MNTVTPARPGSTSRPRVSAASLRAAAVDLGKAALLVAAALSFALLWFLNPVGGRGLFAIFPLLAAAAVVRSRRVLLTWSLYILGFLLFVDLRMVSAEVFLPARFDYVIVAERLLFLGTVPTVWLQQRLYTLASPGWLDFGLIAVHFSFFLAPHLVAIALWRKGEAHFRRYILALLAICYTGLVLSFLLPTAPPWLAAQEGHLPSVFRIMRDVTAGVSGPGYDAAYRAVGENAVAAMPSLHTALTVLVALAAAQFGRIAALLGWVYAAAMAFALVYLGEHYVVDIVAGALLAVVIHNLIAARSARRPLMQGTEVPPQSWEA